MLAVAPASAGAVSVPIELLFCPACDGVAVPAIPPASWRLALGLARAVCAGRLSAPIAAVAVALHAIDAAAACPPDCVGDFATEAVAVGVRVWREREARAVERVRRAVWPLTRLRRPGSEVIAAARAANHQCGGPLFTADLVAQCRAVAVASQGGRSRGR